MRVAKGLNDQLLALVRFLEDSQAYAKSEAKIQALCENGMRETAGEEAQVWNRIMGALDQMHALMGDKKLSLREIRDTLNESLSAAVIKPLPQSADAVHAQSIEQSCAGETKAMILVGMNDRASGGENGLLTPSQKKTLANFAHVYLGPDDADLTRMRRYYLKAAFGMVTDYVSVSCPLSGLDGAGQQPSAVFDLIRALYPNVVIRGGVSGDESIERMLHGAPKAAVSLAATALSDEGEGKPMTAIDRAALAGLQKSGSEDAKIGIRRLSAALNRNAAADALSPAVARELYGVIHTQSITRLERFASCPFSYYIQYGIKPEKVQPYELCAADEGSFFHEAVHEFLLRSMKDLNSLDAEAAQMRMDAVSDTLLEAMRNSGPLGDSAVALAEQRRLKATMRCVAVALAEHMHSSRFHAHALEQSFGPEDGAKAIRLSEGCVLEGRIDRIDIWNEQKKYLRIIDFKRGGKEFSLSQVYHGLSLQLPIYLSAALSRGDALSAGVFYFPLDEGILTTQSTDSTEIEATRKKQMRMQGLLPSDEEVLKAFSPQLDTVVKVRLTSEGKLYSNAFAANQSDYRAMMECAVRRADEDIRGIRNGVCAASPARIESLNPCTYCDYKTACLFDDRLDAQHIRRLDRLSAEMAMLKMKTEQTEAEKGQEND